MGPRLETVYRQMRAEAVPDTDLTEGLEEAKAPASKSKDENEAEDLGPAVVSPDDKDSGPSKAADKMKKTTKATKESVVDEDGEDLTERTTAVRVTVKNARMAGKIARWINTNMGQTMEIDDIDTDGISSASGSIAGDIIIQGDDAGELAQMVAKQFKRDVVIKKIAESMEEDKLSAKQKKIDVNDNGKIDAEDLKHLRKEDDDEEEKDDMGDDDSDEEEKDDDSDEEEKDEKKEAVLTKAEMIQNIGEKMGGLRKTKFEAAYETFINTIDELETDVSVEESARRFAESVKVDVSQDVEALLHGEDISEDFRKKATVIFEAAVRDKVEGEIAKFETKFNEAVQDEVEGIHTNLYAQIDEYLTYCAEEWLKSNELAVETGLKEEITTEFMEGLKELFESKYIEIPAERINVVEELADKNEELEEQLKAEMQKNIDLSKKLSESKREEIIAEVTDNLADTQVEKIKSLAEGLSTDSEEGFREAVSTLRENYYPADVTPENTEETSVLVEDIDSVNETEGMSPSIAAIYDSIKRTTAPKK